MAATLLERAPILRTMVPGRRDWYVIAACATITLLASIGLYINSLSRGPGGGEPIGKLYIRENVAQRKYGSQAVWESLEDGVPIYNNDSIRTGELSRAVVVLNDETEIQIDESTMIVIAVGDRTNINFAYGSIQANRSGDEAAGSELTIQSADQVVTVGASDVQLARRSDEQALDVTVRNGNATVASADGQTQALNSGERATVSEGRIEVQPISFRLTSPPDGERRFLPGGALNVDFSWQRVATPVILEVSARRNFSQPAVRQQSAASGASASLPEGLYYWRISARNPQSGQIEFSEVRRLSVIRSAPVRLQAPPSGRTFEYAADPPFVNFAWSRNDQADGYVLEIARNAAFTEIAEARRSTLPGAAITLPAGDYFWRVRTESAAATANTVSDTGAFRVLQRERPAPPQPAQPSADRSIPAGVAARGLTFTWRQSTEIRETTVEISRQASFEGLAGRSSARGSFTRMALTLEPGVYYWRLRGKDAAGRDTEYSPAARFRISAGGELKIVSPQPGAELSLSEVNAGRALFQWQRAEGGNRYRVTVARDAQMTREARSEISGALNQRISALAAGAWFWKVELLDGDEVVLSSEPVAFRVSDILPTPVGLAPANGEAIDLSTGGNLDLSWQNVAGADYYEVTVTQLGRRPRRILNARSAGGELRVPPGPELIGGDYAWTVRACRGAGRGACSTEAAGSFALIVPEELPAPEIISPSTQYVLPE